MNKQKGFSSLIIILGIVMILGIASGAYYFGTKKSANSAPSPTPVVTSTSQPTSVSQPTSIPSPSFDETPLIKQAVIAQDQAAYKAQGLEPPTGDYIITFDNPPDKYDNKFAGGGIHQSGVGGGAKWFAAKVNGNWEVIAITQAPISCDIVNKYNAPVSLIPGCIDKNNNGVKR